MMDITEWNTYGYISTKIKMMQMPHKILYIFGFEKEAQSKAQCNFYQKYFKFIWKCSNKDSNFPIPYFIKQLTKQN
jgi:hypothetical protein